MDDYREQLKGTGVVPIGRIMQSLEDHDGVYQDEQVVSIAGIVQTAKMKTTRNQSLMAYVTLEDNTGSMELLVFSSTLNQYGSLIHEGAAIVVSGRISIREDKDPQMVVNRVGAIGDVQASQQDAAPQYHTLYLRVAEAAAHFAYVPRQAEDRHLLRRHRRSPRRNVRAAGGHATGAARTARRKKCGLKITLFYNSATHL
mgnify:CR=1 FL=1